MTSNHTPMPWRNPIEYRADLGCDAPTFHIVGGANERTVAIACVSEMEVGEFEANARLIAAAPELLAILRELIELADRGAFIDLADVARTPISRQIRAAIAKAEWV